ncbi:MAG: hypothetical protein IPJ06_19240 [Saprospiraceae bacterium]|nr:hypothetical protein [Saprospiraceae bacterium]
MVIMTWFWSFEHSFEITNPKKQITNKFKIRKINDRNDLWFWSFEIGQCDLFGIWCLCFACLPVGASYQCQDLQELRMNKIGEEIGKGKTC